MKVQIQTPEERVVSLCSAITQNEDVDAKTESFRYYLHNYENWCDEMLTDFSEALSAVRSISLPAFEPGWQIKLLKVAQDLYRIPRQIFPDCLPLEYEMLQWDYDDFIKEADAMGEDLLEFMIALEKHDLEDARSLFNDLSAGLASLESMLTSRWRKIAKLTRIITVM